MKTKSRHLRPARSDLGWEIWDGFAFEPNPEIYPSRRAAQDAADRFNAETHRWQNAPACDAPHLDNF